METPLVDQKVQDTVSGRSPYWDMVDFARQLERDRAELIDGLRAARERARSAIAKGRGNDFYAALVAVEQELRLLLSRLEPKVTA